MDSPEHSARPAPGDPDSHYGERPMGEHARALSGWLARSSPTLRFAPQQEAEYIADRNRAHWPLARMALAMALGFYVGYLFIDALSFQRYTYVWLWGAILGVCALSVAGLLVASFVPALRRHWQTLATAVLIANAVGLIFISVYGTAQGVRTPYEILIIHMLYDFFLIGVRFIVALPTALITAIAYLVLNAAAGAEPHGLFESSFFLFGTVLLGSLACRLLEFTERQAWLQARTLREVARLDPVTGLLNNRAFYARCDQVLRQAQREGSVVTLAVIDLDRFKEFNDTQGHVAGDHCLLRIADVVRDSARRPLDLAARLGGDEFAAVWFDTSIESSCGYAEQLRQSVEALGMTSADASRLPVTVSVGISAMLPPNARSPQWLVKAADQAMYRAKQAGGNLICLHGNEAVSSR